MTTSQSLTDEQLLASYRQGDRAALASIVERHETRLARIAHRVTGCPHESLDVRHSVFVRLLQSLDRGDELKCVGAWLTRCVVNEAVTRVRRKTRENRLLADLASGTESNHDSPAEQMAQREAREALSAALTQMSPDERALLSLRFDEELTFRELAEILDRPASTVKSQLALAIARLREMLRSKL